MTTARTLAKRALALPLRASRWARTPCSRWILTLHEVGSHPWALPPERFDRILEAVVASAAVVPLDDLLPASDLGPLRAAVTFDDGYCGVATYAVPALARMQVPATVFLPTELVSEDDGVAAVDRGLYAATPLMGWKTIRRLSHSALLRFESHGSAHRSLPELSEEARRDDLRRSRETLTAATGRTPRYLAYPFGAADRATASTVRDLGFEAAFTTRHGGIRAGADPFLLPRIDLRADYTPRDVMAILKGDWDFLAWKHARHGGPT